MVRGGPELSGVRVRQADSSDVVAIANVLDGAGLALSHRSLRASVARDDALVAVATADVGEGPVLGAVVCDGSRVLGVAVRRRRRSQGIGTALLRAALADRRSLSATFDDDVRPFYEQLGFAIEAADESGRWRGSLERDDASCGELE